MRYRQSRTLERSGLTFGSMPAISQAAKRLHRMLPRHGTRRPYTSTTAMPVPVTTTDVGSRRSPPQSTRRSGLPRPADRGHLWAMGTKSRESIYGSSIRASAERAAEARKQADRLACEAWNQRMLGFRGPAQPSPALGDALNAGYLYLEVRCLGCDTTKPLPSTSCGDRRQRRSMNWNATCGAGIARRSGAIPTSAAIWWRCGQRRFPPAIRRRRGGRGNAKLRTRTCL